jgi:hypothetical protein
MENSKLVELLKTFDKVEIQRFQLFVKSAYFNQNETLIQLIRGLAAVHPKFEQSDIDRELRAGGEVKFAGGAKQLNYLMSDLLQLAYRFMAIEAQQTIPAAFALTTLKTLSQRKLEKHYTLLYERTKIALQQRPIRDAEYYHSLYQLEDVQRAHFDQMGLRKVNESLQEAADHLDLFYLTEKLKYTCAMLNSQQVIAAPFAFRYISELKTFFETNPMPEQAPAIQMYYRIFRLLTATTADADFKDLKQLISTYSQSFTHEEMTNIYGYALNFCIGKIRLVQEEYVQEALDLYQKGISDGILLEGGKLSPWHFKNVIKLALRSKQYAWTEQFILEKNKLLHDGFKSDALHYNLAELHFYTGQYDKALKYLNQVEFTDIHYNLGAKVILVKIYFAHQEFDALASLLHAFRTFLQRNQLVSESVRKAYLSFIRFASRVEKAHKRQYQALIHEIELTEPLVEKQWLVAQLQ